MPFGSTASLMLSRMRVSAWWFYKYTFATSSWNTAGVRYSAQPRLRCHSGASLALLRLIPVRRIGIAIRPDVLG